MSKPEYDKVTGKWIWDDKVVEKPTLSRYELCPMCNTSIYKCSVDFGTPKCRAIRKKRGLD